MVWAGFQNWTFTGEGPGKMTLVWSLEGVFVQMRYGDKLQYKFTVTIIYCLCSMA